MSAIDDKGDRMAKSSSHLTAWADGGEPDRLEASS